ncbi:MAG: helix-turn-helix domain-containing protein [Sandaracinaceae bacterium]|nr:helix-turn-helix domain-containing protein [Sandaracinaceae bacterium]
MILSLAAGVGTTETARALGTCDRSVRKWRARWEQAPVVESLRDGDRPVDRAIVAETRCTVLQLAATSPTSCSLPSATPGHRARYRWLSRCARGRNQP